MLDGAPERWTVMIRSVFRNSPCDNRRLIRANESGLPRAV
jgi:hypothetical protein